MEPDNNNQSKRENPSDKTLLKMAFGNSPPCESGGQMQKTARGFLKMQFKASNPNVKQSEYTFFKKKVRLNVVEKKVHKFDLDREERSLKKAKKKTSTRKNY